MSEKIQKTMSNKYKILIGGLGGITPVLMNLLVVDLKMLLIDLTVIAIVGYLIRVLILFYLGGIVAFLNRGEVDPVRIFQLGIAAPALVTAFINGNNIEVQKQPDMSAPVEHSMIIEQPDTFQFFSAAYAQCSDSDIKFFRPPEESGFEQFIRGFLGKFRDMPDNIWYVIEQTFTDKIKALERCKEIRDKGFSSNVYQAFGSSENYVVVFGAGLIRPEAEKLREKVIESGLSNFAKLWTFPKTDQKK